MKKLLAIALIATMPAAAAAADMGTGGDKPNKAKKFCTPLKQKGGSRLSSTRLCLTEAQWREKLGSDWRSLLAGAAPVEDIERLKTFSPENVADKPLKAGNKNSIE